MTPLVETLHGSHLFGTATPTSDRDTVAVFLPAPRDILLGRLPGHTREGVGAADWSHQDPAQKIDARDAMYMPLHLFLEKVLAGEPNSVEILFSPRWAWTQEPHPLWHDLTALRSRLVSRDMQRYAYFAYDQAARFGLAPRRYAAAVDAQTFFQGLADRHPAARLRDVVAEIEAFMAVQPHGDALGFEDIPGGPQGRPARHVVICSKRMPLGLKLGDAMGTVNSVVREYGQRTKTKAANGVDWKALSTALRISGEAAELLSTGALSFPRTDADRLTAAKRGLLEQTDIIAEIEANLDRLPLLAEASPLPEAADVALAEDFLLRVHGEAVKPLIGGATAKLAA